MAAGSAAMRGQVRAASWHKGGGAASEAWRGAHRPTYGAALPWRCPRRSPSAHERGHLTAGYRDGSCATTRRGHRPDTRSTTALVAEYSAGAQRP
eukprot:COSAG01_NODE_316_length_19004_cov_100.001322_24_plen_95_part_00